jgi:hypothetical protein
MFEGTTECNGAQRDYQEIKKKKHKIKFKKEIVILPHDSSMQQESH